MDTMSEGYAFSFTECDVEYNHCSLRPPELLNTGVASFHMGTFSSALNWGRGSEGAAIGTVLFLKCPEYRGESRTH